MATNEGPLKSLEEAECKVDSYGAVIGALHAYRVELVDYVPDDEYLIGQAHPEPRNLPRRSPSQEDEVLQRSSPTPSDTTATILLQRLSDPGYSGSHPGSHGWNLGVTGLEITCSL